MEKNWEKLITCVEKHSKMIQEAGKALWKMPELGYKEWRTTAYLEQEFQRMGYAIEKAGNIPGFIADLDTGIPGPKIAVIGELDSLICDTHPEADPETKAVHACGHCCQTAALLGIAAAFKEEEALEDMCGSIRFVAVPAEETIDLEFRNRLIEEDIIHYMAGKIEFLYRGLLDGVDMALMMHSATEGPHMVEIVNGADGCITKHVEYEGKAAHAGEAPHDGINALYAANVGIQACNSLRETFKESDYIRFHPIITQAGVAANAIPNMAKLDAYVRASTVPVMLETNRRINRALSAGAIALGANIRIVDKPGNLPLLNNQDLNELCAFIAEELFGKGCVRRRDWQTISCDMGDLSSLMPAIQPMIVGAKGTVHGYDFNLGDLEESCVNPAKMLTLMTFELLKDNGKRAKEILETYEPLFRTKEEYFSAINDIAMDKRIIEYETDGTVTLRLS